MAEFYGRRIAAVFAGKILSDYIDKNIYECDPTARLDRTGVGMLMKWTKAFDAVLEKDVRLGK